MFLLAVLELWSIPILRVVEYAPSDFFPAKQRHQLREMQKRIQYRFFDITYQLKTLGIQSPCQRMIGESPPKRKRKVIGSLRRQGWAKTTPKKMAATLWSKNWAQAKMSRIPTNERKIVFFLSQGWIPSINDVYYIFVFQEMSRWFG